MYQNIKVGSTVVYTCILEAFGGCHGLPFVVGLLPAGLHHVKVKGCKSLLAMQMGSFLI